MNNIEISGLYSNSFCCRFVILKPIENEDYFINYVIEECNKISYFYDLYLNLQSGWIICIFPKRFWIADVAETFSTIQKKLPEYIEDPINLLASVKQFPDNSYKLYNIQNGIII
jgi:hypothetical protein